MGGLGVAGASSMHAAIRNEVPARKAAIVLHAQHQRLSAQPGSGWGRYGTTWDPPTSQNPHHNLHHTTHPDFQSTHLPMAAAFRRNSGGGLCPPSQTHPGKTPITASVNGPCSCRVMVCWHSWPGLHPTPHPTLHLGVGFQLCAIHWLGVKGKKAQKQMQQTMVNKKWGQVFLEMGREPGNQEKKNFS